MNQCDRDSNGWKIPSAGTRALDIYLLMKKELGPTAIRALLGGSLGSIKVAAWAIRHPNDATKYHGANIDKAREEKRFRRLSQPA